MSPASDLCRSQAITAGFWPPAATMLAASSSSLSARRATSATLWPRAAKMRASSAPMPDEAPVINVTRSVIGSLQDCR